MSSNLQDHDVLAKDGSYGFIPKSEIPTPKPPPQPAPQQRRPQTPTTPIGDRERTVSFPEHLVQQLEARDSRNRPSSVASDAVVELFMRRQPTRNEEMSRIERVREAKAIADQRSLSVNQVALPPLAAKFLEELPHKVEERKEQERLEHRRKTVEAFNQWSREKNKSSNTAVDKAAHAFLSILHKRQPSQHEEMMRLRRKRELAAVEREVQLQRLREPSQALLDLLAKRQETRVEEEARLERMREARAAANQRSKTIGGAKLPDVVLDALRHETARISKQEEEEEERLERLKEMKEKGDAYMREDSMKPSPALKQLLEQRQQSKIEELRRLERKRWVQKHYTLVSTKDLSPENYDPPSPHHRDPDNDGTLYHTQSEPKHFQPHPPPQRAKRGMGRLKPSPAVARHLSDHARRVSRTDLPTIANPYHTGDHSSPTSRLNGDPVLVDAQAAKAQDKRLKKVIHVRGPSALAEETIDPVQVD